MNLDPSLASLLPPLEEWGTDLPRATHAPGGAAPPPTPTAVGEGGRSGRPFARLLSITSTRFSAVAFAPLRRVNESAQTRALGMQMPEEVATPSHRQLCPPQPP